MIFFPVPSGPPQSIFGEAVSSDEVFFQWDLPPLQHQNGIIIGYIANITTLEIGTTVQISTSHLNLTLDALRAFTTYSFIVAARTSIGLGPFSTTVNVQTLEDGKNNFM